MGRRSIVSLMTFLFFVNIGNAQVYRNDTYRFQFSIPEAWIPIPEEELLKMAESGQQAAPRAPTSFVAGFRAKRLLSLGAPMVIVQVVNESTRGMTYDRIERDFSQGFAKGAQNAGDKLGKFLNLQVGQSIFERERNRMVSKISVSVPILGQFDDMMITNFGANAVVCLHCYGRSSEFGELQPKFTAMADSFQFDPGLEFKEAGGVHNLAELMGRIAAYCVIGAGIGWLIKKFVGSSKKKVRRVADDFETP